MKLFVTEKNRDTPPGWERAYTAPQAIAVLQTGVVDEVNLSYNLGSGTAVGNGGMVLKWIAHRAISDPHYKIPKVKIHSDFPGVYKETVDEIKRARE